MMYSVVLCLAKQFLACAVQDDDSVAFAQAQHRAGVFGLLRGEAKRVIVALLRGDEKTVHEDEER